MGLFKRYKTVKAAEKRERNAPKPKVDVDELDEFDLDAGDALEAEVAAELEKEKRRRS
jgi:hypothetical protein